MALSYFCSFPIHIYIYIYIYIPIGHFCSLLAQHALPQGPSVLPPADFTDAQAIIDSFICDLIELTASLLPSTIIFPYGCNRSQHGVHSGCCINRFMIANDNRHPISHSSMVHVPEWNRLERRFAFHRLTHLSPAGITIIPNHRPYDPIADYDLIGAEDKPIVCSECEELDLDLSHSNAITFVLRTVSQQMDSEF